MQRARICAPHGVFGFGHFFHEPTQFFAAKELKELKENPALSSYQYLSKSSQAVTISRSGQLDL